MDLIAGFEAVGLSMCSAPSAHGDRARAKNEIRTKESDGWNEDASFYNVHRNPVLECEYDRGVHALYEAIEKKRWDDAYRIFDSNECQTQPSEAQDCTSKQDRSRAEVLAMTWVYRKSPGDDGRIKWRITVLHAAVIFDAPSEIFRKILEAHPAAAKLKDDRGNLPLHLAFKSGLDEDRINILLDAFRDGMEAKNNKGLTPFDCAAFCRKKDRRGPFLTFVSNREEEEKQDGGNESVKDTGLPSSMPAQNALVPASVDEKKQGRREGGNDTVQELFQSQVKSVDDMRFPNNTGEMLIVQEEIRDGPMLGESGMPESDCTMLVTTEDLSLEQSLEALSSGNNEPNSAQDPQPSRRSKSMMKKGKSAIGKVFSSSLRKNGKHRRKQQQPDRSATDDSEIFASEIELSKSSDDSAEHENLLGEEETAALGQDVNTDAEKENTAETASAIDTSDVKRVYIDELLVEPDVEAPPILKQLSVIPECSSSLEQSSAISPRQFTQGSINTLEDNKPGTTQLGEGSSQGEQRTSACNKSACSVGKEEEDIAQVLDKSGVKKCDACTEDASQVQDEFHKDSADNIIGADHEEGSKLLVRTKGTGLESDVEEKNGSVEFLPECQERSSKELAAQDSTQGKAATADAWASSTMESARLASFNDRHDNPPIATVISAVNDDTRSTASFLSAISTDTERMQKYHRPLNEAHSGKLADCCGVLLC